MTTILPTDANDNVIPALRLKMDGAQSIPATSALSTRNAIGFSIDTRVISVYATGPVYLRFGELDVIAASTDHYFPEGVYYDFAVGGNGVDHTPYLAVIAADTDCNLYISEKD